MTEGCIVKGPIGVSIVGGGYWGSNLVRVFHELGRLVAICDSDLIKLERLKGTLPSVRVEENFDSLLDEASPPAMVIATPAEMHFNQARKALLAGKDVFVEKPLALKPHDGEELVRIAKEKGRILMVGHILLYHPAIVKLKSLIDSGELGRIQYIYSNRLNLGKIRREENILWSFAPHDISVILMLLGEMPTDISSHGGCYLHSVIQDVTVSTLAFRSGVRAHLFVSWLHPFKEQKLVVVGDRQMAVFDDLEESDKLRLYSHQIEWVDRVPIPHKAEAKVVPVDDLEPLKEECRSFLNAILSREDSLSSGSQGLKVLQVLDACQRSLEAGGQVTKLTQENNLPAYFVHPTSIVDERVEIGVGTKIWHFSHIMSDARIGQNCNIGQNVVVASDVTIGNNVKIQNNVSVYTGVSLEDDVFCGPSVVFTNVNNPRSAIPRKDQYQATLVKRGATLGANATVVCGHNVGRYALVGAGAVVTRDVPDHAMVVGSPARIIGWACECGIRLTFIEKQGRCPDCGRLYILNEDGLLSA
ncbi:MAG TPA: Gfo/Idh/MocA family oxidoreductase [Candidatus Paceibacterota bacterium]